MARKLTGWFTKLSVRAPLAALLFGVALWVVGGLAETNDFQNGNLLTGLLVLVGLAYVVFEISRFVGSRIWWFLAIPVVAGSVGLIFYRFDGFSGEMMPLFSNRFGSNPQLRRFPTSLASSPEANRESESQASVVEQQAADETQTDPADRSIDPTVSIDDELAEAQPSSLAPSLPAPSFTQFLGNNRDGVITKREFDIPRSPSDVEVLWDQGIGKGWASFAIHDGLAITLEQRDQEECVTAYRLDDGSPVWIQRDQTSHENLLGGEGPRSTPLIQEDRVYALGATGKLRCLDLATGLPIWDADLMALAGWSQTESEKAITWGRSASPLWVDGACVVPLGGPDDDQSAGLGRSLIAFDGLSGDVLWRGGSDQISYASPVLMTLDGQRQIVSVNEETITGHDPTNGQTLWSFPWYGQSNAGANCATAIPAGKNRFVIGKGYGGGSALVEVSRADQGWTVDAVWESSRLLKTKFNHACVLGSVAYSLSNGLLEAVHLDQERSLWRQPRRGRFGQGQVIAVEDVLVVQGEDGDVAFVRADPDGYDERCRLDALDHKTWNIPTVAGRYLIVRNDRRAIAYRLPARGDTRFSGGTP